MTEEPLERSTGAPATDQGWRGDGRIDLARTPRAARPSRRARPPGSIPAETTVVGRDELLQDLQRRVLANRMTTLTGPGGVGKTALAQRIAWTLQRAEGPLHPVVVRWVELDSIGADVVRRNRPPTAAASMDSEDDEAAQIDKAVAAALGIYDFGQRSLDEVDDALRRFFARSRDRTVLVLDNCEHVVDDTAELCQLLLDATEKYPDKLRLLCTSREALACNPEYVVPVSPLDYPEDDRDIGKRATWPAIDLFWRCMEQYGNPLPAEPEPDTVRTVAHIVRDAAGLPLAIKIAAGLARKASLAEVLAWTSAPSPGRRRRSGRDTADRGGLAGVVPEGLRRTFAASMRARDWSDELDIVLQRLAVVFDGSFDGEAAAAICADVALDAHGCDGADSANPDGRVGAADVLDLLGALVDKSLVAVDTASTSARFHLLRPVRRFGAERLYHRASAEEDWLRERHVRFFYDRAVRLTQTWMSPIELEVVRDAQQDSHNFRAAVAYACSRRDLASMAVGIVASRAQARLFHRAGDLPEGKKEHIRLAEAVKDIDGIGAIVDGLITTAIWYALCQGELEEASRRLRAILTQFPGDDERDYPAVVCMILAIYRLWVDQDPRSIELFALSTQKNVEECTAVLEDRYRFPEHLDELIHMMSRVGMTYGLLIMSFFSALAGALLGTEDQARSLTQEFMDRSERCGAPTMISWSRIIRAIALMCRSDSHGSDLDTALQLAEQAVVDMVAASERWGTVWAKHLIICVRAARLRHAIEAASTVNDGDRTEALRLATFCGAARKLREISNVSLPGMAGLGDRYQTSMEFIREVAGSWAWEQAESAAHALDDDQAVRFGTSLDVVDLTEMLQPVPDALRTAWLSLSPQEQEVTYHVAAGRSGAAIAARLEISEKTVDQYAKRAKNKFGIVGRREQFTELYPLIKRLTDERQDERNPSSGDARRRSIADSPAATSQQPR